MRVTKYLDNIDSGNDFIGTIPSHWKVERGSAFLFEKKKKNVGTVSTNYLSLMANRGIILYEEKGDVGNKKPEDLSKCKVVTAGDFVLNSMNYSIGSYGVSPHDGVCSPVYVVMENYPDKAEHAFVNYILSNRHYQSYAQSFGTGILDHRRAIGWDEIKQIPVALPPLEEQSAIAAFLDREIAQIDYLVAKKIQFISLIKEKRAATISHSVTKGIRHDTEMQKTSVEWIGEIPASWKLTKLGYLGRCANGINIGGDAFGSGYPFVSYGDVYNNRELPSEVSGLVQSTRADRIVYSVKSGDVLFTRTSETIDEIAFPSVCSETIQNAVFAGFLIRFRPFAGVLVPRFSKFAFQNRGLRAFFVKEMKLVTRASLSQGLLRNMPVALPPIVQQEEIAEYLEETDAKFERLITKTMRSIDLLKEKRTALITAAVTGKIDVRSAA